MPDASLHRTHRQPAGLNRLDEILSWMAAAILLACIAFVLGVTFST